MNLKIEVDAEHDGTDIIQFLQNAYNTGAEVGEMVIQGVKFELRFWPTILKVEHSDYRTLTLTADIRADRK